MLLTETEKQIRELGYETFDTMCGFQEELYITTKKGNPRSFGKNLIAWILEQGFTIYHIRIEANKLWMTIQRKRD